MEDRTWTFAGCVHCLEILNWHSLKYYETISNFLKLNFKNEVSKLLVSKLLFSKVKFWSFRANKTSKWKVVCSNPAQEPQLSAKAVHCQPPSRFKALVQWSIELRGQTSWVPYADGIKLKSSRSVKVWTSLVRNCLNYPAMSTRTRSNGILAIHLASSQNPSLSFTFKNIQNKKTDLRSADHDLSPWVSPVSIFQTIFRVLIKAFCSKWI